MIGSYLLVFTPVFAAGVFTGWFVPWVVREWRRGLAVIADAQHGGGDLGYEQVRAMLEGKRLP